MKNRRQSPHSSITISGPIFQRVEGFPESLFDNPSYDDAGNIIGGNNYGMIFVNDGVYDAVITRQLPRNPR